MNTPTIERLAVNERQAAAMIGISSRSLWKLRKTGCGPAHAMAGARIIYPIESIKQWIKSKSKDCNNEQQIKPPSAK